MTGATISGSMRTVCTSFCPRKGRFSAMASARPTTSEIVTLANMNRNVFGNTMCRNSGSVITVT